MIETMKNRVDKILIITSLLCLAPMILTVMIYDKLPDQVAVHWSISGVPNNFAPKAFAGFGMPLLFAVSNTVVYFVTNADPKRDNYAKVLVFIFKAIMPVFSLIIVPVTLLIAIGIEIDMSSHVPIFMGILFIVVGNYFPKTKQNYTMGIKLPWTLHSEENWNKTHRLAGYTWIIGGILIIISSLISAHNYILNIILLVTLIVVPMVYSYLLYKKGI